MRPSSQNNSPKNSPHMGYRTGGVRGPFGNGNLTNLNMNVNSNSNSNGNVNNLVSRYSSSSNNNYEQPNKCLTPKHGTPVRGRQTANLLASLDKSILQIRDWLTLLEGMLKKDRVDIADIGHICHMLERQRVSCNKFFKNPLDVATTGPK